MLAVKKNQDDSLGAFIHKLNREDMPLFSQTVKNILDVSNKEDSPLSDLSLVVLKDPSLTAKVLMIANCALYSRDARKTTTISRAVLQLGYKVVRSVCITSLLIEKLATGPRREMVIAEMVKSFHAAIQARSLAISRGDPAGEEIFIATLLYRIGHIAFWSSGGAGAELLSEALQKRPEEPPKQVEKDILGFSLQELSYGLAKEWGLGDLLETSLSIPNQSGRSVNVLLGHALADGIASGWKSAKLEKAISKTAKFLNRSEEEVTKLVKENTEMTIKTAQDYGLGAVNQLLPPESEPVQDSKAEAPSGDREFDAMVQLEILSELNSLIKDPRVQFELVHDQFDRGYFPGNRAHPSDIDDPVTRQENRKRAFRRGLGPGSNRTLSGKSQAVFSKRLFGSDRKQDADVGQRQPGKYGFIYHGGS